MEPEVRRKYEQAGRIAAGALAFGVARIKPGASMREVLDQVEEYIHKHGGEPAFPAQSCVNNVAAHYCPTDNDDVVYKDGDVVKIDVGVHVDGYIGDNATTVCLGGEHKELCRAVRDALASAQEVLRDGCLPDEIGAAVEQTLGSYGLRPVRNLTGHGLRRYTQHAPPTIPSYPCGEREPLREGMVIAIEPFATNGSAGLIYSGSGATLFSVAADRPLRTQYGRQVQQFLRKYNGLPFTTRWVTRALGPSAALGLAEMRRSRLLHEYPPLPEKSGGMVAQHENTFLITADGAVVLTKE